VALPLRGRTLTALYFSATLSIGAWHTRTILLACAVLGRMIVNHEDRAAPHLPSLLGQMPDPATVGPI